MADIWEKFDKSIDTDGLRKDVEEAAEGGGEFKEVPHGVYEVALVKLELKETKESKKPMLSGQFKILNGEHKNSLIFYNQVIASGFGIHNANEFMRSMGTDVNVEFTTYRNYNNVICDVFESVSEKLEFQLNYSQNNKGFNIYTIEDIFEV